jgi:hypothetical protein
MDFGFPSIDSSLNEEVSRTKDRWKLEGPRVCCWMLDVGCWMLDVSRCKMQDARWMVDGGWWMVDGIRQIHSSTVVVHGTVGVYYKLTIVLCTSSGNR